MFHFSCKSAGLRKQPPTIQREEDTVHERKHCILSKYGSAIECCMIGAEFGDGRSRVLVAAEVECVCVGCLVSFVLCCNDYSKTRRALLLATALGDTRLRTLCTHVDSEATHDGWFVSWSSHEVKMYVKQPQSHLLCGLGLHTQA